MNAFDQVAVLLKLFCYVGPVAVYFITLGLINSQSTPRLVSARGDFVALTIILSPLLFAPVPLLWTHGLGWVLPLVAGVMTLAVRRLLPESDSGWVVYNLGLGRAQPLIERALGALGWSYERVGSTLRIPQKGFHVTISQLPLLRNATIQVRWNAGACDRPALAQLRERLEGALSAHQQLPSITGCGLLLAGVAMLMLPLWMMSRHSEAIAEVVNHLLLM